MKKFRIIFFCPKTLWLYKTSRVRFLSIEALGRNPDVEVIEKYIDDQDIGDICDRLKPNAVIWYKPFDMKGYEKVKCVKCIRYNEMYDTKWTLKEIKKSKSDLVVCHHYNDWFNYDGNYSNVAKFINIPHCAETGMFKDWKLKKEYDILISGAMFKGVYPFRRRLRSLLPKHFNCKILNKPKSRLPDWKTHPHTLERYSQEINKAKIAVATSSKYRYALEKYVQIPMSGTLLAGDIPDERNGFYKKFMLILNRSYSDEEIVNNIKSVLNNKSLLKEQTLRGMTLNQSLSMDYYASKLLSGIKGIINE